jgi:hypothetical protein
MDAGRVPAIYIIKGHRKPVQMELVVIPLFIVFFASMVVSSYYGIVATLNRQPGVPYFPGGFESPANILFRPHQLTEKGLRARRSFFIWSGVALSTMVLNFFLALGYEMISKD